VIDVIQSNGFKRAYKKLHPNQKAAVDDAVAAIVADPTLGEAKKGDLAGVFVYKFDCVGQVHLLAYEYDPATRLLLLVGTHENFYRDLKR
jgi:mRNA interferase RelE/StbE